MSRSIIFVSSLSGLTVDRIENLVVVMPLTLTVGSQWLPTGTGFALPPAALVSLFHELGDQLDDLVHETDTEVVR